MKRTLLLIALLLTLSLACSLTGVVAGDADVAALPEQNEPPLQSEKVCGDGVCDGPENPGNCPEDCDAPAAEGAAPAEEAEAASGASNAQPANSDSGEFRLLYQIADHSLTSFDMSSSTCYALNFRQFLDAGIVQTNGRDNQVLELQDHPTSMVSAKVDNQFYYISTPENPVNEMFGTTMFNWDVADQTLWSADFATQNTTMLAEAAEDRFPGGLATSPGNRFLAYLITQNVGGEPNPAAGFLSTNMNPFISDSSLLIANLGDGEHNMAIANNTNRQLFSSFADFSPDGSTLFTLARAGESFKFVKVELASGQVSDFAQVFPGFDWGQLNWDEFFPPADDFSYAHFSLSPDQTRLIAYKNVFTANMQNVCVTEAAHHLWVFDLEGNTLEVFRNQPGYVSSADWKPDSSNFALARIGNAGCYPDYLDSSITLFDKNGATLATLTEEAQSKITHIGWSPEGSSIAYDVYGTDYIGRLKLVDVTSQQVTEVINTQTLGYQANADNPVTLLFADWVAGQ